jgi:hypothetical protein
VAGSFWSLDLVHFLISVVLHASLTHAAFAHGGWRGKAESAIGSDRTCKVRTYLLEVALGANPHALRHQLAVVADQEAPGEEPGRSVLGAAPGADVVVVNLREEER